MVLAALEHGVGSCWVSPFELQKLTQLLRLPANHLPSEILVFGYPDGQPMPRKKKALKELVFRNVFKG